jgi:hypothetical protein
MSIILSCVLYCLVCCVLFERGVLVCVMCVFRVLCLILLSLPRGKNQFTVQLNNSNNNNYDYKPFSRSMFLGSTQPLTKMSIRNLPAGKGRRSVRKSAICESIV